MKKKGGKSAKREGEARKGGGFGAPPPQPIIWLAKLSLLDRLELRNHVPNEGPAVERDVRIVREIVHDHDRARDAEVERLILLREASLRFRRPAPDVPRDRRVFGDLVEDVH